MQTTTMQAIRKPLTQAVALGLFAAFALPAQAVNYSFSDLGTLAQASSSTPISYAVALSNLGHVIGHRATTTGFANGEFHPTVWNGSSWVDLPVIPGSTDQGFQAINDHDQITGQVGFAPAADLYLAYRYDSGTPVQLPRYNATSWFQAGFAINNNGQVVGDAFDTQWVSAIWNADGSVVALPNYGPGGTSAYAINDAGVAVGYASDADGNFDQAVYWDAASHDIHTLQTLSGQPGPGRTNDINNLGQIIGSLKTTGSNKDVPVLWNSVDAAPQVLPLGLPGFHDLAVTDINDHGQMLGTAINNDPNGSSHLFLWDHGTLIDLSLLLPAELAAEGWKLFTGYMDINNLGQITGSLINSDNTRYGSFLFTPVPVPGAVWLFGSALAGLIGIRRRTVAP